jgi:hypothetical protein
MLGGPETGKTSYSAILYGALSNDAIPGMSISGVHDELRVLNDDLDLLGRRMPVTRSESANAETLSITVATEEGVEHQIEIPDRSGEALKGTQNARQWHGGLLKDINAADGLMIFLSPVRFDPGEPTETMAELVQHISDDSDEVPKPWSPAMLPSDVRSIDILQEIDHMHPDRRRSVALVVSACDLIGEDTPLQWVEKRASLLLQFLSDHPRFRFACFGISAQGARFSKSETVEATEPDPWDRAWARDGDGNPIGLFEPIAWLLNGYPAQ